MKKNKLTRNYKAWILPTMLFLVFGVVLLFQRIAYLSAGPSGEKDCPPLNPESNNTVERNTLTIQKSAIALPWKQKGGNINDASCLNRTPIHGIITVTKEEDIKNALLYAKENELKISTAGVRHSMGGQAFFKNVLVLDMLKFNKIELLEKEKTVIVQSGATWHDIQNVLHPKFAIKAMQSTDIFSVGGSISVNAHGMDHNAGSVARTVKSMRIMLPDGTIEKVSKQENPDLFNSVIGGYGLFGVILDAELEITENEIYETERTVINYKDFPAVFTDSILTDKKIGLFYGHLSTSPDSFLKEMILYTYKRTDSETDKIPQLTEVGNVPLRRFVLNFSKHGSFAKRLKWFAEKHIEPKIETCSIQSRNQAMKEAEACLVSRNEPMHDSVPYLRNSLKNDTDILHEYFIPRTQFVPYIDGMRKILVTNKANLLNASVRVIHKEEIVLNYAPEDMYSIVLYINQTTDTKGNQSMKKITQELVNLTLKHSGKFFLPYQLYYTDKQLQQSYPQLRTVFAAKRKYDPDEILTNTFYEKFNTTFSDQ